MVINLQELGKIIFNMELENFIILKLEKASRKNGEKVKSGLGKQLKMISMQVQIKKLTQYYLIT
jgi:hypothetical protein